MRILYAQCANLRHGEDQTGYDETPDAAAVEYLDNDVGTDAYKYELEDHHGSWNFMQLTTEKPSRKAADRQYGDVQLLVSNEKVFVDSVIPVAPQGIYGMPNVAVEIISYIGERVVAS